MIISDRDPKFTQGRGCGRAYLCYSKLTSSILQPTYHPPADGQSERKNQTRFQQAIAQVLGAALEAQGINLSFGDFKCKVPWVLADSISDAYHTPEGLRRLLGQPLLCMRHLGSAYGFLSNYKETIFLRQTQLANGQWHVEYSPGVVNRHLRTLQGS